MGFQPTDKIFIHLKGKNKLHIKGSGILLTYIEPNKWDCKSGDVRDFYFSTLNHIYALRDDYVYNSAVFSDIEVIELLTQSKFITDDPLNKEGIILDLVRGCEVKV